MKTSASTRAARALRAIPSSARTEASRVNGRRRLARLALLDDLGQYVGECRAPRSRIGERAEYGWRGEDGVLHVEGMARIVAWPRSQRAAEIPGWIWIVG